MSVYTHTHTVHRYRGENLRIATERAHTYTIYVNTHTHTHTVHRYRGENLRTAAERAHARRSERMLHSHRAAMKLRVEMAGRKEQHEKWT